MCSHVGPVRRKGHALQPTRAASGSFASPQDPSGGQASEALGSDSADGKVGTATRLSSSSVGPDSQRRTQRSIQGPCISPRACSAVQTPPDRTCLHLKDCQVWRCQPRKAGPIDSALIPSASSSHPRSGVNLGGDGRRGVTIPSSFKQVCPGHLWTFTAVQSSVRAKLITW